MGFYYEKLVRPWLFRLEPEHAHELAVAALGLCARLRPVCAALEAWSRRVGQSQPVRVFGLDFPNAVGLAAGFDKNATAWPAAAALGFGHVEIGTVTALPQGGNPRPRVFRYPGCEAVINRMGFNNDGAGAVASRLARQAPPGRRPAPVGVNIGKSRSVDIAEAVDDYMASFRLLADFADYVSLNVSSPNTPGLRELQEKSRLEDLLCAVSEENSSRAARAGRRRVPVLVKIAPDLSFRQVDDVLEAAVEFGIDGIIATNTTLARPGFFSGVSEAGGLSGAPLRAGSTEIVRYIARSTAGRLPVIGVGGISDPESAAEKFDAGAALVQVYTGLVYRGPFLARELCRSLSDRYDPENSGGRSRSGR